MKVFSHLFRDGSGATSHGEQIFNVFKFFGLGLLDSVRLAALAALAAELREEVPVPVIHEEKNV